MPINSTTVSTLVLEKNDAKTFPKIDFLVFFYLESESAAQFLRIAHAVSSDDIIIKHDMVRGGAVCEIELGMGVNILNFAPKG